MILTIAKESLWKQFGASIDMLKNAIEQWPEERWHTDKQIFDMAYHTLFFLDYYLTIPAVKKFTIPLPFTFTESSEIIPNRTYTKQELLGYLQSLRERCHRFIAGLTEETMAGRWIEERRGRNYNVYELLLYNMRHVQHHAAQLNLLLRQKINQAPGWVSRAEG